MVNIKATTHPAQATLVAAVVNVKRAGRLIAKAHASLIMFSKNGLAMATATMVRTFLLITVV